jgi:hypothetical protein
MHIALRHYNKSNIFWETTLKVNIRFVAKYRFHLQTEAKQDTRIETGGKQNPTHRLSFNRLRGVTSPEDSTLHNHRSENIKSYIIIKSLWYSGM